MKTLYAGLIAFMLTGTALAQGPKSPAATVSNASNDHLLWLFAATILIAIGFAVWQLGRVRKAKRQGDHSALADSARPPEYRKQ